MNISLEQRNRLMYIALFGVNVVAGWAMTEIGGGSFPWFADPANAPYRTLVLALLGPAVMGLTTWLMANRPRWGKAEIAAQVDQLGEERALIALVDADSSSTPPLPEVVPEVGRRVRVQRRRRVDP